MPRAVLGMSANGSANLVFADRDGATKAGWASIGADRARSRLADASGGQPAAEPEPGHPPMEPADSPAASSLPAAPRRRSGTGSAAGPSCGLTTDSFELTCPVCGTRMPLNLKVSELTWRKIGWPSHARPGLVMHDRLLR